MAREVRREARWRLLVAVLAGLLAVNCTFTIFNVALVRIAGDLRTTQTTLTWAITGPLLVVGVTAPVLGRLGDLRGHRRLYLLGMCGSLACAALTAVAWDAPSLIAARLLSGLGDACITAASWALLFRVFRPGERTRVLGWWSLVGAGGPVLGVAVGGPVVQAVGWRWVFVGQVPLVLAALLANWRLLPDTPRADAGRVDVRAAAALAVGVGSGLLALNQGGAAGWTSPLVLASAACCPIGLASFAALTLRSPDPLFPLGWLRRRGFVLPCLAGFAINFCYMGGFFLSPLFLERALGYGIGVTGVMQIARPLLFSLSAPAAGYLATRTGERTTAVGGAAVMVASMLVFAAAGRGTPGAVVVLALALSGLANGVAAPSLAACVANSVDVARMGSAAAGSQVFAQVGVVAGIQVMETIQVARQRTGLVGSFHVAYLTGALVGALALVAAAGLRAGRRAAAAVEAGEVAAEVLAVERGLG